MAAMAVAIGLPRAQGFREEAGASPRRSSAACIIASTTGPSVESAWVTSSTSSRPRLGPSLGAAAAHWAGASERNTAAKIHVRAMRTPGSETEVPG